MKVREKQVSGIFSNQRFFICLDRTLTYPLSRGEFNGILGRGVSQNPALKYEPGLAIYLCPMKLEP